MHEDPAGSFDNGRAPSHNGRVHAETAYLFRHALLRDAAYQLQLPADRARLHALAFEILERLNGGRPPWPEFRVNSALPSAPLASDAFALELAQHAEFAAADDEHPHWREAQCLYLSRAAFCEARSWRPKEAARHARAAAALSEGRWKAVMLLEAAGNAQDAGLLAEAEDLCRQLLELESTRSEAPLKASA